MSFGPSNTTKTAENNLSGTSNLALNDLYPKATTAGTDLLATGKATAQPGINFFNTMLAGNRANTTALLQPSIDRVRNDANVALTGINTLTPRGGGRGAANYGLSFAPQASIANLFTNARTNAANILPQIGMQQQQLGTNLFGLGANALGAATGANSAFGQMAQADTRRSDSLVSGLAGGLFSLATTPFGGGSAKNGLLGLI